MTESAISKIGDAPSAVAVGRSEFALMREQAADLIASGYLPRAIDKPEKAVAIIMLGRELGMGPWQSFNSIDVIQGRPTLKPIGMAALVNRFVEARGGYLRVVESTAQRCTVEYLRPPAPDARRVAYTIEEARAANLLAKDTWKQYPADMLRNRAISRACREGFSDVILGLYTDEEVEAIGGANRPATATTTNVTPIAESVAIVDAETVDVETGEIVDAETRPAVEYITPRQIKFVWAIANKKGLSDEDVHAETLRLYEKTSVGDLTRAEVSSFIEHLQGKQRAAVAARKQAAPAEPPAEAEPVVSWTAAWKRLKEIGIATQMQWMELTGKAWPGEDPQAAITLGEEAVAERDRAIDGTAGNDKFTR